MQGLDLTYETLGKTRNEAAIDVLIAALEDANANNRRRALAALMSRSESRSPQMLLAHWSKLQEEDVEIVRARKQWMHDAIANALGRKSEIPAEAMMAAEALRLTSVLPKLISIAESAASRVLRSRASSAVATIVEQLGVDARNDRDQTTLRGPVITRLGDSLRRFSMHRNEHLTEAFLVCSTWSDVELRQLIAEEGPTRNLICKRLSESNHPRVLELLAGFIRRRNLNERIASIIETRSDDDFRHQLLRKIGSDPTQSVWKNLREIGLPRCCRGDETLLQQLPAECRAAFVHAHVACSTNYIETLHVIAAAIESGTQECVNAATLALSRCESPDADCWMRAALHIAEDDETATRGDETARLLKRLIALLDHPDASLNRAIRRVLRALHASEMLPQFQSLRSRSRRRLGRIVMMIDGEAIERVRDALRHPVLTKRLEAIAMADALEVVDDLYDSFAHITREDHQEARMRAAEAMSDATSDATLGLLHEMISLPECPVRDTAVQAIHRRQKAEGGFNSRTLRTQS